MKHNLFIKGITLTCFIALVGSFLFYRSGGFNTFLNAEESHVQSSHNGGKIATTRNTISDSTKSVRLSSSKSLVITDNERIPAQTRSALRDMPPVRMSSSKSLVLTDNDPLRIDKRKRDYLYYAISLRSEIFQDSLRRSASTLPLWLQLKLDSIRLNSKNWFHIK